MTMSHLRTSRNEPDVNDLRQLIRDLLFYTKPGSDAPQDLLERAQREAAQAQDREWKVSFYRDDANDNPASGPWTHAEAVAKARSMGEKAVAASGGSLRTFADGETVEWYGPRRDHRGTWEVERID